MELRLFRHEDATDTAHGVRTSLLSDNLEQDDMIDYPKSSRSKFKVLKYWVILSVFFLFAFESAVVAAVLFDKNLWHKVSRLSSALKIPVYLGGHVTGTNRYRGTTATKACPLVQPSKHSLLDFDRGTPTKSEWVKWRGSRWDLLHDTYVADQQTCLTYNTRYLPYQESIPPSVSIPPTTGTTTALIYRVRGELFEKPLQKETLNTFRAIVIEVQEGSRIDLYFMVHLPWFDSEREAWRDQLPIEFKSRIIEFDDKDAMGRYPPGTFKSIYDDNIQLSVTYFFDLQIAQQYDFVWWLEEDVRNTGSWTTLFNFINASIPLNEPKAYDWELRGRKSKAIDNGGPWRPDLIVSTLHSGQPDSSMNWEGRHTHCAKLLGERNLAKAYVHLTGVSRGLSEIMKSYFYTGVSCYCEYFLISVAKRARLPIFVFNSPAWYNNAVAGDMPTFHWVGRESPEAYYEEWKRDNSICRPGPALLHQVRLGHRENPY